MERGQLAPCRAVERPRVLNKVVPGGSADGATAVENNLAKCRIVGHREVRPGGWGRGRMQFPPSVLVERPRIAKGMSVLVDATKEDDLRMRWEVHQWRAIEWRWGEVAGNRELLIRRWLLRAKASRRRSAAASTGARRQQRHGRKEPRNLHVDTYTPTGLVRRLLLPIVRQARTSSRSRASWSRGEDSRRSHHRLLSVPASRLRGDDMNRSRLSGLGQASIRGCTLRQTPTRAPRGLGHNQGSPRCEVSSLPARRALGHEPMTVAQA
jgi:hypothetical protein